MTAPWCRLAVAGMISCTALATGCTSDRRASSGITIETLAASTGTACPVPLDAAVTASGVERTNSSTGEVSVSQSFSSTASTTGIAPGDTTTLDRLDAIAVSCSLSLNDQHSVRLLLVTGRRDNAGVALLPRLATDAAVTVDGIEQVGNDMTRTKVGALVSVPGDAPVAVLATEIKGATSSWLLISARSLSRLQVEQIARQLDNRLR